MSGAAAEDAPVVAPRMPGWMIARSGEVLSLERLRMRLAAYVYGNILVLAAVVIATGSSIDSGGAALLVGATTLTTYVAHILAHDVGQHLGRDLHEHRPHVKQEIRDAMPILYSGLVPSLILLIGLLNVVPSEATQLVAALWVVVRLALIGFLVERLNGRKPTWRTLSGGLALAVGSAVVVVIKVLFAH